MEFAGEYTSDIGFWLENVIVSLFLLEIMLKVGVCFSQYRVALRAFTTTRHSLAGLCMEEILFQFLVEHL